MRAPVRMASDPIPQTAPYQGARTTVTTEPVGVFTDRRVFAPGAIGETPASHLR